MITATNLTLCASLQARGSTSSNSSIHFCQTWTSEKGEPHGWDIRPTPRSRISWIYPRHQTSPSMGSVYFYCHNKEKGYSLHLFLCRTFITVACNLSSLASLSKTRPDLTKASVMTLQARARRPSPPTSSTGAYTTRALAGEPFMHVRPLSCMEIGRFSKASFTLVDTDWSTSAALAIRSLFHNFNIRTVRWNVFGLINIDLSMPKSS